LTLEVKQINRAIRLQQSRVTSHELIEFMTNVWHELIQYESMDLVAEAYGKRHGRELSAGRTRDITSSFIQAREYYVNAAGAALSVRPLLQYYGVAALTRGLILLAGRKGVEALRASHGLDARDWNGTLARGLDKIGDLEVTVGPGMFLELIDATGNKSYLKANSNRVNWHASFPDPSIGDKFSLADIAASLPDVMEEYQVWKGAVLLSAQVEKLTSKTGQYEIQFSNRTEKGTIAALLGALGEDLQISAATPLVATIPDTYHPYLSQFSAIGTPFEIGDVFIVPPIRDSLYLNTLALYFSASYILGMLVRYFPAPWIAIGRQQRGDRIFPMINRLVELIQMQFPQIVIEFLRSPYHFEIANCQPG
jgi:YaaC-like protein